MKKALLIVDVQKDFLPGGALEVKEGDQIVPLINQLSGLDFDLVVAVKDWHPKNHGSFAEVHGRKPGEHAVLKGLDQILWPVHCVQGTDGAAFSEALEKERIDKVIFKGVDEEIDSYSAFFDNGHLKATGLEAYLKKEGVTDLYVAGLATDYCVKFSVLDAIKLGLKTYVVIDACRAVNLSPEDDKEAVEEMKKAGAKVLIADELLKR